jgi:hypothetical protein
MIQEAGSGVGGGALAYAVLMVAWMGLEVTEALPQGSQLLESQGAGWRRGGGGKEERREGR